MDKEKLCNKLFGNFEFEWIIYHFQLHTRMPNYFYHLLHSRLRLSRWAVGQYFQILEKSGESTHIVCCEATFKRNYIRHESILPLSAACINAVLPFSPVMFKSAPFWMSNSASLSNPVHTIKTLKNVSIQNVISYIWMIPRLRAMINTESMLTTLISAPFSMSSLIIPSCAMSFNWKRSFL